MSILYDPTVGHPHVTNYQAANARFAAQEAVANSFMDAATGQPRIIANPAGANTRVRISDNGRIAIEAADLSHRQPKLFFADQALLADWNERLMRVGSQFQLIPNTAEWLQFDWQGQPRHLVRVDAMNLENNTSRGGLKLVQACNQTVQQVIGALLEPAPVLGRAPATPIPNQPGFQTVYESILQYYVADELGGAGQAHLIDLQWEQNNPATPNLPVQTEAIATAYGTAMYRHRNGVPNPALAAAAQAMRVNEYAMPDVGQGLVTYRLGETVGGQVRDNYHNRTELNPSNQTLWRYHWGGVVAKDGNDYVTLENYARNAEDNLGDAGADPRFYFQMYGAGASSWHEVWAANTGQRPQFRQPADHGRGRGAASGSLGSRLLASPGPLVLQPQPGCRRCTRNGCRSG